MKTIPVGIYSFMGQYGTDWTYLMAATMVALLPVIVVFVIG